MQFPSFPLSRDSRLLIWLSLNQSQDGLVARIKIVGCYEDSLFDGEYVDQSKCRTLSEVLWL